MNRNIARMLALMIVAIASIAAVTSSAQNVTPIAGTPVSGSIEGLYTFDPPLPNHSPDPLVYAQIPPIGGIHNPAWQNCGFYAEPVASEHAVHSLEHGAIWITYDPALAADQTALLQEFVNISGYVLISPFIGLPSPIVVTSWDHQLYVATADDPRIRQFVGQFTGKAPEPGAPCAGGTSETVSFATPIAGSPVAGSPVASPEA